MFSRLKNKVTAALASLTCLALLVPGPALAAGKGQEVRNDSHSAGNEETGQTGFEETALLWGGMEWALGYLWNDTVMRSDNAAIDQ